MTSPIEAEEFSICIEGVEVTNTKDFLTAGSIVFFFIFLYIKYKYPKQIANTLMFFLVQVNEYKTKLCTMQSIIFM